MNRLRLDRLRPTKENGWALMANSQHLKWILEGVESWNDRQEQSPFIPDLSGVNIYKAFDEANMLDDDGRIPLRGVNLFAAKMCGAILGERYGNHGADLRDAKLQHATLEKSYLRNAVLDGANLDNAMLNNACLRGASLRNAVLTCTDLVEANLEGSNLTEADFSGANLRGAVMSWANVMNTGLYGVGLADVVLYGVDLWESKLFYAKSASSKPTSNPFGSGGDTCNIQRIEELLNVYRALKNLYPKRVFYFRGEPANNWGLRPSVMRERENGQGTFREKEHDLLQNVLTMRPNDFLNASSAFDEWVIARHHGLPTRLLDLTRNPLVALFWACEGGVEKRPGRMHVFSVPREMIKSPNSDEISILSTFAKLPYHDQQTLLGKENPKFGASLVYSMSMERLQREMRKEKYYLDYCPNPKLFFKVFIVEPRQSFERIRAQRGAFLLSAFHERLEREMVLEFNSDILIYDHFTFEIPHDSKDTINDELRLLDVSRETLLPSLDEAVEATKKIYST